MRTGAEPPLLQVQNLRTYFPIEKGLLSRTVGCVKAVDGVTLHIDEGETLGLVGESGCGKSTLGRTIVRLHSPSSGMVSFRGRDFAGATAGAEKVQMVFQDPYSSLNPRMTVGNALAEVLKHHHIVPKEKVSERIAELFTMVELSPEHIHCYPHEFSGGQRQRIGIARALAVNPRLIICDEIVSALDVSVQAQIINLLKRLQTEQQVAYLFIAHDLAVVRQIAQRIAVMYCGRIVEYGQTDEVMTSPAHPYTRALISVAGNVASRGAMLVPGEVANPADPPSGCHFHPRCPLAVREDGEIDRQCRTAYPNLVEKEAQHSVACHFVERVQGDA